MSKICKRRQPLVCVAHHRKAQQADAEVQHWTHDGKCNDYSCKQTNSSTKKCTGSTLTFLSLGKTSVEAASVATPFGLPPGTAWVRNEHVPVECHQPLWRSYSTWQTTSSHKGERHNIRHLLLASDRKLKAVYAIFYSMSNAGICGYPWRLIKI